MIKIFKNLFFNKSFLLGLFICFAMFSKYILGPDNLIEELGEKKIKDLTNINIDFSPESK